MKRLILLFLTSFGLVAFTQPENENHHLFHKEIPVNKGEYLEFKLSYGWFTVGRANLQVSNGLEQVADKDCYKIEINGRTAGIVGAFSKVRDTWGAYVTKDELLPVVSYSDLQEGNYQRKEYIQFDQESGTITVEMTKKYKKRPLKVYEVEGEIHDLLSGYMNLRSVNWEKLRIGDTVEFKAFYDEVFYDFGAIYQGKDIINTPVGELGAYRIVPLVPPSSIFPKENAITAWISSDLNQLPLRVEADMFFGTAYCELTNYKNIKYGPDFQ